MESSVKHPSLACISCDTEFHGDLSVFLEHMTQIHEAHQIRCTGCPKIFESGSEFAQHFINDHYFSSPSSTPQSDELIHCPFCAFSSLESEAVMNHTELCHAEPRMGGETSRSDFDAQTSRTNSCPVCDEHFGDLTQLEEHVNGHFQDSRASWTEEAAEFQKLQKLYGFDNSNGGYEQAGTTALSSAYETGNLSLASYYDLKRNFSSSSTGIEPSSPLQGIPKDIHSLSRLNNDVVETFVATDTDFYGSNPTDFGFGCGFRNIQMLLSSLLKRDNYRQQCFNGKATMPSIPQLQLLIEEAWKQGFDGTVGAAHFGGKLHGTRKWIGTTEVAAFLSSKNILVQIVDFTAPTGPGGTFPLLFSFAYDYFSSDGENPKPPLYFQHEGHSRTIVGVEKRTVYGDFDCCSRQYCVPGKSGEIKLLLLDPSQGKQMCKLAEAMHSDDSKSKALHQFRFFRKGIDELKGKKEFQLLAVRGISTPEQKTAVIASGFDLKRLP